MPRGGSIGCGLESVKSQPGAMQILMAVDLALIVSIESAKVVDSARYARYWL